MPLVVDPTGVQIQTLDEILAELFASARDPSPDGFGPDVILDEAEPIPTILAIVAERLARAQATVKSAVDALVPGSARGVHAENIAAITGTERLGGTPSTVAMLLTGTPAATVEATEGSPRVYRHNPTNTLWEQIEDVILDGSGEGTVTVRTQDDGPVDIVASTDWDIIVGDPDLTAVESTADSELGRLEETDEELEARRVEELGRAGQSTVPAIRGDIQQDLRDQGYDVDAVAVFVNFTERYDADGRPPGSVEVLIDDNGLVPDAIIAAAIWNVIAGGARPWGTIQVSHVDDDGITRDVRFSRTTDVTIWMRVTLDTTGAEVDIADPAALIEELEEALVAYGDANHPHGRNVNPGAFMGTVYATAPGGSLEGGVTIEVSDDGVSWQTTPWAIAPSEVAAFDATRVSITIT